MRALPLLILSCIALLANSPAPAQSVQRCMGANGQPVYTDRRCDDIGAVQRVPPAAAAGAARWTRQDCPRRLSELVGEIGAAIQSHDVNRLSAIHDWRGVPAAAATSLFDRLEAMVGRPLVDIAPVYAQGPAPPAEVADASGAPAATDADAAGTATTGPQAWMPSWQPSTAAAATAAANPDPAQAPMAVPITAPARARPVGLRIEQTLAGSATRVRTVLGLRRAYGCFWISL